MSVGVMKDQKLKLRELHDSYTVPVSWGTGTPKDRDEVNKREVSETLSSIVVYYQSIKRLSFLLLIDKARAKDKTYI
jgi:hypothetical protein